MSGRRTSPRHRWMYPLRWRWKIVLRRLYRRRFGHIVLLGGLFLFIYFHLHRQRDPSLDEVEPVVNPVAISNEQQLSVHRKNCTHFTCFDVYHCNALDNGRLSVYSAPPAQFFSGSEKMEFAVSDAFRTLRKIVKQSRFYSQKLDDACVFIPPIDLLAISSSSFSNYSLAINALSGWNHGRNFLIFTFRSLSHEHFPFGSGSAIIASPVFTTETYRRGFDVAIPFPLFLRSAEGIAESVMHTKRSSQLFILTVLVLPRDQPRFEFLAKSLPDEVLIVPICRGSSQQPFYRCSNPSSPLNLTVSSFCYADRSLATFLLGNMLSAGCIPVIPSDSNLVLPFDEVLDWSKLTVASRVPISLTTIAYLKSVPLKRIANMSHTGRMVWERVFSSWKVIVETTLQVINDRMFPKITTTGADWIPVYDSVQQSPIFLPGLLPVSLGFTAIILTFDRTDSLFQLISLLGQCRSLAKVLVIWNNPSKLPPNDDKWPAISQPVRILQMSENVLSNRFVPYGDIETEAIFSLDDDILMLTPDEIEFGFQVWLENSDRLVGFPSRLHVRNASGNSWQYDSEWGSVLSVVLTGASFFSKTYSHYYTHQMPKELRDFVDQHVNCEDLAMNFLVSNITGKGPIKVGPRKKFRCPTCSNVDMLSSDSGHLFERSLCVNYFASVFGGMPLLRMEFRADTVLYKADVTKEELKYPSIGML